MRQFTEKEVMPNVHAWDEAKESAFTPRPPETPTATS